MQVFHLKYMLQNLATLSSSHKLGLNTKDNTNMFNIYITFLTINAYIVCKEYSFIWLPRWSQKKRSHQKILWRVSWVLYTNNL